MRKLRIFAAEDGTFVKEQIRTKLAPAVEQIDDIPIGKVTCFTGTNTGTVNVLILTPLALETLGNIGNSSHTFLQTDPSRFIVIYSRLEARKEEADVFLETFSPLWNKVPKFNAKDKRALYKTEAEVKYLLENETTVLTEQESKFVLKPDTVTCLVS